MNSINSALDDTAFGAGPFKIGNSLAPYQEDDVGIDIFSNIAEIFVSYL